MVKATLGDMTEISVPGPFRLVYVVINSLFLLTTQAAQIQCFRKVAEVLEPGGRFVTECFFPDLGRFDRGQSMRVTQISGSHLKVDASRHDPVKQIIVGSHVRIDNAGVSLLPVTIRYSWPTELDLMAQLAGLVLTERWDSWEKAPYSTNSGGVVSVYQRPAG